MARAVVRTTGTLILLLAALAAWQPAHAQSKDPAAADALFRQAREAMKQGDYASAYPKLVESNRLDPAAGTALNLAQCEHKIGKLASALTHYKEAAEQLPYGDPRVKVARDGIAELEPRVPRLSLKLPSDAPPGTRVSRDDVELGAGSLGTPLPVEPGEHVVVTRAPGRKEWRQTITIAEAERRELTAQVGQPEVEPTPDVPVAPLPAPRQPPASELPSTTRSPTEAGSSGSTLRTAGYVVGAIGLVGVGAGAWYSMRAKGLEDDASAYEHYHPDPRYGTGYYCDAVCAEKTSDSRDASKIGYAGFIGGGALIAGGLAMILLAPSGKDSRAASTSIRVSMGPGATGVHVGGAW